MKRNLYNSAFTLAVVLASVSPALANITDITIQAELEEVASLQIESISCNRIVSVDNIDPSATTLNGRNEVLNFGLVNPLGLETGGLGNGNNLAVNRAGASENCTDFTVQSMVVDNAYKLYNPVENASNPLPHNNTNIGALYFTKNAVQLRSLRTGGNVMDVDIYNEGSFDALVAKTGGAFSYGDDVSAEIAAKGPNPSSPDIPFGTSGLTLQNDVAQPVDLGIIVPYSMSFSSGPQTTIITFKGQ
jgi:hypothetical protein